MASKPSNSTVPRLKFRPLFPFSAFRFDEFEQLPLAVQCKHRFSIHLKKYTNHTTLFDKITCSHIFPHWIASDFFDFWYIRHLCIHSCRFCVTSAPHQLFRQLFDRSSTIYGDVWWTASWKNVINHAEVSSPCGTILIPFYSLPY